MSSSNWAAHRDPGHADDEARLAINDLGQTVSFRVRSRSTLRTFFQVVPRHSRGQVLGDGRGHFCRAEEFGMQTPDPEQPTTTTTGFRMENMLKT